MISSPERFAPTSKFRSRKRSPHTDRCNGPSTTNPALVGPDGRNRLGAVAGVGNVYGHDCEAVDEALIWHTVRHDAAQLRNVACVGVRSLTAGVMAPPASADTGRWLPVPRRHRFVQPVRGARSRPIRD